MNNQGKRAMDNPTGAENAQVQDDADRRAREITMSFVSAYIEGKTPIDRNIQVTEHFIATALREAEQREAIVWEFAVARHVGGSATRDLVKATANDPEYRNRAIERAASPPATEAK